MCFSALAKNLDAKKHVICSIWSKFEQVMGIWSMQFYRRHDTDGCADQGGLDDGGSH
jgi:hypothetical protein